MCRNQAFRFQEGSAEALQLCFAPSKSWQHRQLFIFNTVVTFQGIRYALCTSCTRVQDLDRALNASIYPTCKRVFIWEKCRTPPSEA